MKRDHQCDNCSARYTTEELEYVRDLAERLDWNGPAPSGECPEPECGALCYYVPEYDNDAAGDFYLQLNYTGAEGRVHVAWINIGPDGANIDVQRIRNLIADYKKTGPAQSCEAAEERMSNDHQRI